MKDTITLKRIPATKPEAKFPFEIAGYRSTGTFAVIDLETSGVNPEDDEIIELGVCIVDFNHNKGINRIVNAYSELEQPSVPVIDEITRITGINNEMVRGRRIDGERLSDALSGVDFIVAHNAGFDRKFFDKRFPEMRKMPWACSMSEFDWRSAGYETKALKYLLMDNGWFFDGHRASIDAVATAWLLDCDRGAFDAVVSSIGRVDYTVRVLGNSFAIKDKLSEMGMRFYDCKEHGKHWYRSGAGPHDAYCLIEDIKSMGHSNVIYEKVSAYSRYK